MLRIMKDASPTLSDGILSQMAPPERSRLLGDILTLMSASKTHQEYRISHFASTVLPPVQLNQFRIYHDASGAPVGFVSWALLSDDAERRLLSKTHTLREEDWNSGDTLYFMEFIAPFGHIRQMVTDLRQRFAGVKAHAVRFDKDRDEVVVSEYYGLRQP